MPGTAYADGGAPNLAYVAGAARGISVIDVLQRRVVRTISLASSASTVLLSSDGSMLYSAQPGAGRVVIFDTTTSKVHCMVSLPGQPAQLALAPQGDVLYAAGAGDTHVRSLDPHTCKVQQTFQVAGPISGLAVTLLGGAFPKHSGLYQLWVATPAGLTVLDPDGTLLDHFSVPGPQHLCYATGFALYATTFQGTVVAIDLVLHKVTPPLLRAGSLGTMDYNATTGEIYVPTIKQRQVFVLTPITPGQVVQTGKVVQRLPMQSEPEAVAITSDGQLGFVALQNGQVVMLDIPGRRVVTTFSVGGHPQFIITGLYPPVTALAPSPAQTTSSSMPPWRGPLLIVLVTIFCLSLFSLIYLLISWWKQHAPKP